MTGIFSEAALALAMIAAFILLMAGIRLVRHPAHRQHGLLMIGAAIVLVANVLIWTI